MQEQEKAATQQTSPDKRLAQAPTDLAFVYKLLALLKANGLPAPSPIEQRWTARSESFMSPAYSTDPDQIFSWVGVIMYLPPTASDEQRAEIGRTFRAYAEVMEPLLEENTAQIHWAKLEVPNSQAVTTVSASSRALHAYNARDEQLAKESLQKRIGAMRKRLAAKYPLDDFIALKDALDPQNVLSTEVVDRVFKKTGQ